MFFSKRNSTVLVWYNTILIKNKENDIEIQLGSIDLTDRFKESVDPLLKDLWDGVCNMISNAVAGIKTEGTPGEIINMVNEKITRSVFSGNLKIKLSNGFISDKFAEARYYDK